ncbi:CLUMA_CG002347, isoform A [Clunio marinus]|uniref:CLUMA_CG002347, isoform A n=1 Tax=Clunio marinus TaxID=568069 RepID=A0A1J1HKW3_9DIPT|nr:CLUMA_CG002347, isoform A [Clunio marinus]
MVESQDSLYTFNAQNDHLELGQINTEDLLVSSDDIMNASMFSLSPNGFQDEFNSGENEKVFVSGAMDESQLIPYSAGPKHLYQLPSMEDINNEWDFNIFLHSDYAGKTTWMYSPKLHKVFVKINTSMHVNVKFENVDPSRKLFVRAMIVYSSPNEFAEPVKKCPNHRDQSNNLNSPEHILRSPASHTVYIGKEEGKLFGEKLAILVSQDDLVAGEPLKLQFTCQNSCSGGMNRKSTSIIFTLENEFYEILGRKVLAFKVCSCPKRDKEKEEESCKKPLPKKRKPEAEPPSTSKKIAIQIPIKQEVVDVLTNAVSFQELPSDLQALNSDLVGYKKENSCEVTVTMPNEKMKKDLLKCAFDMVAGEMARTANTPNAADYQPYLENIQKQIDDNN